MKKEFLESGRRTRFAPKVTAERPTMARGSERTLDPTVSKAQAAGAVELLTNETFVGIITFMVDEATEEFQNSPEGQLGQHIRDRAHGRIKALDAIVTRLERMTEDAKIYEAREAREADPNDGPTFQA